MVSAFHYSNVIGLLMGGTFVRLHNNVVTVTFTLANSGSVAGHEVNFPRSIGCRLANAGAISDPTIVPHPPFIGQCATSESERIRQRLPHPRPEQDSHNAAFAL